MVRLIVIFIFFGMVIFLISLIFLFEKNSRTNFFKAIRLSPIRPVISRPCLSADLAFPRGKNTKTSKGNKNPPEGLKLAISDKPLSLEFSPLRDLM